jgi:DNA-directed RNA polymerase specialized sigma24 family protein
MFLTVRGVDQSFRRSHGSDLPAYNELVVQHQDEAFTLACDLLGNETMAAEAVEEAFRDSFRDRKTPQAQFRLEIMKKVAENCEKRAKILPGPQAMAHLLTDLTNTEKTILVLVDCLEMSYADAGYVTGKPPAIVGVELAKARFLLNSALNKNLSRN